MRRSINLIHGLAAAAVALGLLCGRVGAQPLGVQETYLVISQDAPEAMKYGGSMRWICDGTADNVEIQAAIDAAQAIGTDGIAAPTVVLTGGTFTLAAPIYIGYSGTTPLSNHGVNLRFSGNTIIDGANIADLGKFTVYLAPKNSSPKPTIVGPVLIKADYGASAGALFVDGVKDSSVRDVRLHYGEVCTFWVNNSYAFNLENITIAFPSAMAFGCRSLNASTISTVYIGSGDGDALGGGSDVGIRKYTIDNLSGTFFCGEEVKLQGGSEQGVLLSKSSTDLIIGHATRAAFTDGQTIEGIDSGATADVDTTIEDIGCAMYLGGGGTTVDGCNIENVIYSDDDDGYDFPLVLVDAAGFLLRNFRFETQGSAIFPATGSDAAAARMAKTWFKFDGTQASPVSVAGLDGCRGGPNTSSQVYDASVTVTDDGAAGTVTLVGSDVIGHLEAGDTVYLWDGAGGITDQAYTVNTPTGTQFGIDEDPGSTETAVMLFCVTSSNRVQPETMIDANGCWGLSIRNVSYHGFSDAAVDLDASCRDCVLDNVTNYQLHNFMGAMAEQNKYWFHYGSNGPLLVNAGVNTKVLNAHRWQYAFDYPTVATPADNDNARQFDGAEVASATVMDISSAWGPEYKVYVTGTTQVDELDGGYVGQVVTLIGVHVATGFLIDDDDARTGTGAIDLIGANDDTTLQAYEAIRLICIVDTAAAQIWVEPGNW